jgi:hypothetical protein
MVLPTMLDRVNLGPIISDNLLHIRKRKNISKQKQSKSLNEMRIQLYKLTLELKPVVSCLAGDGPPCGPNARVVGRDDRPQGRDR